MDTGDEFVNGALKEGMGGGGGERVGGVGVDDT